MADRTELAKLLLNRSLDVPGSPLFKSQAEISRLIVKIPDSGYEEAGLKSFLNQVLKGRRRCNDKLANCIITLINEKLQNQKHCEKVKEIILQGIQDHNDYAVAKYQSRFPGEVTRDEAFEKMLAIQKKANSVFIINSRPLELVSQFSSPKQQFLVQETIRSILKGKLYIFCVPDILMAEALWKSFYKGILDISDLQKDKNRAEDVASAKLLSLEQDGVLTVYLINPRDCIHSTVVYNAGDPGDSSGWIWYVPWNSKEIAEMPKEVLYSWTQNYFYPISAEKLDGQERIKWAEIEKRIR